MSLAKNFEKVCKTGIEKIAYIYRISDFGNLVGISNPCDFFAYKYPYMYMLEMKTTAGSSLPLKNISNYQYNSMLCAFNKYKIKAYFLVWYYDKNITRAIPVDVIRDINTKSIRYDYIDNRIIDISGEKKKVYFEYDWEGFFKASKDISHKSNGTKNRINRNRGFICRNGKKILSNRRR